MNVHMRAQKIPAVRAGIKLRLIFQFHDLLENGYISVF